METVISGYVLEFLVRHKSVPDGILNGLIQSLPIPQDNWKLKKRLILQELTSNITKGIFTEKTMEMFERIKEYDLIVNKYEITEALKLAYSTIGMRCTAKLVVDESTGTGDMTMAQRYVSAVQRIWSVRVREFGTIDVFQWVHDVEAGIVDLEASDSLVKTYKQVDVKEAVANYVNQETQKLGLSFLELSFHKMNMHTHTHHQSHTHKPIHVFPPKNKLKPQRGATVVEPLEKFNLPQLKKETELETTSFDPHALRLLMSLKATMSAPHSVSRIRVKDEAPSSSRKAPKAHGIVVLSEGQNRSRKRNVMEASHTAHHVQRNDAIEQVSRFNSPKTKAVSHLNISKITPSRRKRRWAPSEEEALVAGVNKWGKGSWKLILMTYHDKFDDRTEGDLKDKWRNMIQKETSNGQVEKSNKRDKRR